MLVSSIHTFISRSRKKCAAGRSAKSQTDDRTISKAECHCSFLIPTVTANEKEAFLDFQPGNSEDLILFCLVFQL